MRILFVHPAAEFSIWDVGQGLRHAFKALGHDIRDYYLNRLLVVAQQGIREHLPEGTTDAMRDAIASEIGSQGVVAHAVWHQADLVVVVSGLNLHPGVLWALRQIKVPVAVWLTESPYEDAAQAEWVSAGADHVTVFTHEEVSALAHGWHYLPHAFDPGTHRPVPVEEALSHDVLFIGTGWGNRQRLLEAVDWTGIRLRLHGVWPEMTEHSPLRCFLEHELVPNAQVPRFYCSAAINLNLHRESATARSMNPRSRELAACGAFQISDARAELDTVFGDSVPVFRSAAHLEQLIRHYLTHPEQRHAKAAEARRRVEGHTFIDRATTMLGIVQARQRAA